MYTGYQTNGFLNVFPKATHPTTHHYRLRQSTLAVLLIEEGIKPKEEDAQDTASTRYKKLYLGTTFRFKTE